MRYLLIILGLVGMGVAIFLMAYGPPDGHRHASGLLIGGSVFFAVGAATVDVVEALSRRDE